MARSSNPTKTTNIDLVRPGGMGDGGGGAWTMGNYLYDPVANLQVRRGDTAR